MPPLLQNHIHPNYLFAFGLDLYFGKTIDAFDRLPVRRFSIRDLPAFDFALVLLMAWPTSISK
jgi:hypothetical protein